MNLLLALLLTACLAAPTPAPPALRAHSSALTLAPNGTTLAAVNPDSDSITFVDAESQRVIAEVAVGNDPRTVAFTPDGALAVVANHGADTVSIVDTATYTVTHIAVGPQPYGVVADSTHAYISLLAAQQVVVLDLKTLTMQGRMPTEPFPTGLALHGENLYVAHFYSGRVTHIHLATQQTSNTIATDPQANLSQAIVVNADGTRAYLPQTRSNADNRALTYDTAAFPIVSVIDLTTFQYLPNEQLELATLDRPVAIPFAAALNAAGTTLYVVNAASDDVSVIDLPTRQAIAHLTTGAHPRGLALTASHLFINNTLAGTLSQFSNPPIAQSPNHPITLTTIPLSSELLTGKRLFNSALPPMAQDHWLACATCHFEGGHDARTWLGFPDGPRNTPTLLGISDTFPLHWSGDLDEAQDVEFTIRRIQGGLGLIPGEVHPPLDAPNANRSADLDALTAYLLTLRPPPSPTPISDEQRDRGERAFRRWGCSACHTAPLYSDLELHDTPIGDPTLERNPRGQFFDTPALLGVWATAPYFHDGSAPTLRDTLFSTGFHSMGLAMNADEVEDIVAFMLALP